MIEVGKSLTRDDVIAVSCLNAKAGLDQDSRLRMLASRKVVEDRLTDGQPHYGINTGFGALAEVPISIDKVRTLQLNLVRSHSSGVGPSMPTEVVRAAMLLRAHTLALGLSGIRPGVIGLLLDMLNARIHPLVPSKGSVGASGDLAPLAHIALTLVGEGQVEYNGKVVSAAEALRAEGLNPVRLEAKEGLSLINGTQMMTAVGVIMLWHANHLAKVADIAGAMSLEAVRGTPVAFDARIQRARPHAGQGRSAKNLRTLLADSEIRDSHKDCKKVQDPYSLRCMPQVHGAVTDALDYVAGVVTTEINSVTDNPLVFDNGDIVSGGNFHGEPVALAMDFAGISVAELASISERRVEHLLNPTLSDGLPPFLVKESGLNSGFMIAQVAAASLVSENKILAHPASVDSIPSSANREDHVSMGLTAANKAMIIIDNVRNALAVEVLAAAQGLDLRLPLTPGIGVRAAHDFVRQTISFENEDRVLAWDIDRVSLMLRPGGGLVEAVTKRVGRLM